MRLRSFNDFLRAMEEADLEHLTLVLFAHADSRHGPRHDPHTLLLRAINEAMLGYHPHLLDPGPTLSEYLASVIDEIA